MHESGRAFAVKSVLRQKVLRYESWTFLLSGLVDVYSESFEVIRSHSKSYRTLDADKCPGASTLSGCFAALHSGLRRIHIFASSRLEGAPIAPGAWCHGALSPAGVWPFLRTAGGSDRKFQEDGAVVRGHVAAGHVLEALKLKIDGYGIGVVLDGFHPHLLGQIAAIDFL